MLLLNPISEEERIKDSDIIKKAKAFAKEEQGRGEAYHPAANKYLDIATGGRSSILQLKQLIRNVQWARELSKS